MSNRVVIDTNTVVSAVLIPRSIPRQAFDKAFASGIVIASDAAITELTTVIKRKRFDRYLHEEERFTFLAAYINATTTVTITEKITDCRDEKDNKFLEAAVAGQATHIVTGDQDLLVLHPYRGIAIVTPRDFLSNA
jgi:putative PIN family toxin of toxin-antitoxin system